MSDEQSGLFYYDNGQQKQEYLSVGDNATITGVGKETSDCSIVS